MVKIFFSNGAMIVQFMNIAFVYIRNILKRFYDFSVNYPKKYILLIIKLFFFFQILQAQVYNFRQFTLQDGLSQSQVFDMCQDTMGLMWFATYGGGVTVYDGHHAKVFTGKDGLPGDNVRALYNSRSGKTWIGTTKGLSCFNGYKFESVDSLHFYDREIYDIAGDRNGRIWIAASNGIWIYDQGEATRISDYTMAEMFIFVGSNNYAWWYSLNTGINISDGNHIDKNILNQLDTIQVTNIIEYDDYYFFGTVRGLYRYNGNDIEKLYFRKGLNNVTVTGLAIDNKNRLWIGSQRNGLIIMDGDDIITIDQTQGIQYNNVLCLYADKCNNIWIGTDGRGAFIFNGFDFIHYPFDDITPVNFITSICRMNDKTICFGTDGNGIIVKTGSKKQIFNKNNGLSNNHITDIKVSGDGLTWITTLDGINIYDGSRIKEHQFSDRLRSSLAMCVLPDNEGNVWIGTNGGGLSRIKNGNIETFADTLGFKSYHVWDIYESNQGFIYFGTQDGIFIYDGTLFQQISEADGLIDNAVGVIKQDRFGNMWFGTEDGLSFFDGTNFYNYGTENGLSSNMVYSIEFTQEGHTLICSEKGIDRISLDDDKKIKLMQHFGAKEGFKGTECNARASFRESNGNVWFGTIYGAVLYQPGESAICNIPPKVYVSDMRLFYRQMIPVKKEQPMLPFFKIPTQFQLEHNQNNLTFYFSAIDFHIPENVRYKIKLEGLDKEWLDVAEKNYINYSNIPPGDFTFKVRASNHSNIWQENPFIIRFTILRPFWKKIWFYVFVLVLSSFVILGTIRLRNQRLKSEKRQLEALVSQRTDELQKQKEEIESQKDELERLNATKDKFFSIIAHDLKNPFHNLINTSKLLLKGTARLNEQTIHRLHGYMYEISKTSYQLLENLLEWSFSQTGKSEFNPQFANIKSLIEEVFEFLAPLALDKNIEIINNVDQDDYVFVDVNMIKTVFRNILSNAVKFTNKGGWIKIGYRDDDNYVYISVKDNGIGIEEENQRKIFEIDKNFSKPGTEDEKGTGLGLVICLEFVRKNKGDITVESKRGAGSTFTVSLPKS